VGIPGIPNIDNKYIYINREVVHTDKKIEKFGHDGMPGTPSAPEHLRPMHSQSINGVPGRVPRSAQ
tara:strand:+ start:92 stop:289 length:198 start_codon:yes stop_codon:yes gene_type:complete